MDRYEKCYVQIPHCEHWWGSPIRFCTGVGSHYKPSEAEARGEVLCEPELRQMAADSTQKLLQRMHEATVYAPYEIIMHGDAPSCHVCGVKMVRIIITGDKTRFIYRCLSCGVDTNVYETTTYGLLAGGRRSVP